MPINPDLKDSLTPAPNLENLVDEQVPLEPVSEKGSNWKPAAVAAITGLGLVACSPTVSEQPTDQEPTPIPPTPTSEKPTLTPGNVGGDTEIGKEPMGSTQWDGLDRYPAAFGEWLQKESGSNSSVMFVFAGEFRPALLAFNEKGEGTTFVTMNYNGQEVIASARGGDLQLRDKDGSLDGGEFMGRVKNEMYLLNLLSGTAENPDFTASEALDGWRAWYKQKSEPGKVNKENCLVSPVVEVNGEKGILVVAPDGKLIGFLKDNSLTPGQAVEWSQVKTMVETEFAQAENPPTPTVEPTPTLEPSPTPTEVPPTPTTEPTPTEVPPTPTPEQTKPTEYTVPAGRQIPVYDEKGQSTGGYVTTKAEMTFTIVKEAGDFVLASYQASNGNTYERWLKRSEIEAAIAPAPTTEPQPARHPSTEIPFMTTDRPNRQNKDIWNQNEFWGARMFPSLGWNVVGVVKSVNPEQNSFVVDCGGGVLVTILWEGDNSSDKYKSHLYYVQNGATQTYEAATVNGDIKVEDTVFIPVLARNDATPEQATQIFRDSLGQNNTISMPGIILLA